MSLAEVHVLHEGADFLSGRLGAATALSRLVTNVRSEHMGHVHPLNKMLTYYGRAPVPKRGRNGPASHPDLPIGPWPTGRDAARRRGITNRQLREQFAQRLLNVGAVAVLDVDVLSAFVPRELWAVVEQIAIDGPGLAGARGALALQAAAAEPVRMTKRKPAGRPASGTVDLWGNALRRVFAVLVEMRAEEVPWAPLDAWRSVPPLRKPDLPPNALDSSGPRLALVREAWRGLNEEIAEALGIDVGDDELSALAATSDTALARASLFKLLRGRVTLGLLVLTGSRVSAIARLTRGDYISDYRGPGPDHRQGPALVLRPGKTLHPDLTRIKMLPPDFARCIDAMLEYRDRCYAVRVRQGAAPTRTAVNDEPLLLATLRNTNPWGDTGIRNYTSGLPPSTTGRAIPALIPRENGVDPALPASVRTCVGYSPHSYRHTASGLAEIAGERWNKRHAGEERRPYEPGLYATALEDQESSEDKMRALYGDRDTDSLREVLAARAIDGIWALLATDEGARRTPDRDGMRDCLERREALRDHRGFLERRTDEIHAEARRSPGSADLILRVMEVSTELRRTVEHLADAEVRLRDLRHDRRLWAPLPDTAPPEPPVDVAALEQELLENLRVEERPDARQPEPLRPWVTVAELEYIVGTVSRSELSRWLLGKSLPKRADRRPWEADTIPVDENAGSSNSYRATSYRRIDLRGVKETFWRGEAMRCRLAETLARWPSSEGWATKDGPNWRCLAPLAAPGCEPWEGREDD